MYDISDISHMYCDACGRILCILGIYARIGGAYLARDRSINGGVSVWEIQVRRCQKGIKN